MSYHENKLTEIANAIRSRKGTTGAIQAQDFADEINNTVILFWAGWRDLGASGWAGISVDIRIKRGGTTIFSRDFRNVNTSGGGDWGTLITRAGDTITVTNRYSNGLSISLSGKNSMDSVYIYNNASHTFTVDKHHTALLMSHHMPGFRGEPRT